MNKFNIISNDYEFNCLKIMKQYTHLSKNLIIGTCYRPPSGNMDNFMIKLNERHEKLEKLNCIQYMIGDFNIDLLKSDNDQEIQLFLSQQVSSAMLPLITVPTRITSSSCTIIDNYFSNNFSYTHSSFVLVSDISDHYPILISLDRKEVKKVKENFVRRSFSTKNLNQFINNCQQVDWKSILQINDAQQAVTTIHSQINDQFLE